MELILAVDLLNGCVVQGKSGNRAEYKPLDWGISDSAIFDIFIEQINPRYIYVADLDRIEGKGNHDDIVMSCADSVKRIYLDRGCRFPNDLLNGDKIVNVIGTETAGSNLGIYKQGYLSVDVKDGKVIPDGREPETVLKNADSYSFDGCILLNLGGVGTQSGLDRHVLEDYRAAYSGRLLFGGGVADCDDLNLLCDTGYDGAIVSTAVHKGVIPVNYIRSGTFC